MKHLFLTIAGLSMALNGMAWGQKGHDTTCAIAQRHLTPAAAERIAEILDGKSIVYWSNWFDNAVHTPEYEYAKTWHYKNIDADQQYADVAPFETGDVVSALYALRERIEAFEAANTSVAGSMPEAGGTDLVTAHDNIDEATALKMFVHLMGDLHQPMHMGHATDLGGNRVTVKFFGRDNNLHGVWDTNIVESAHAWSHTEWVEEIDRTPAGSLVEDNAQYAEIVAGNFDTWGAETFGVCREVYNDTPQDTRISYDYVAKWGPTVEEQFLRGGLRLAQQLNDIFQ